MVSSERPGGLGAGLGLAVPVAGPGVCAVCHGPGRDGRPVCWCCRAVSETLGPHPCPMVVPVALYRTGDRLHAVLRGYKDAPAAAARHYFAGRLGSHLAWFLDAHGPCITRAAGTSWDSVAVVPSSTRTPDAARRRPKVWSQHPLGAVVAAMPSLSGLARIDVVRSHGTAEHLAPSCDAFAVGAEARGRRVLLLDDTWVTGARVRSAAAALSHGGAVVVAVVVAGRAVGAVGSAPVPALATWWRWAETRAVPRAGPRPGLGVLPARARCCLVPCGTALTGTTGEH